MNITFGHCRAKELSANVSQTFAGQRGFQIDRITEARRTSRPDQRYIRVAKILDPNGGRRRSFHALVQVMANSKAQVRAGA